MNDVALEIGFSKVVQKRIAESEAYFDRMGMPVTPTAYEMKHETVEDLIDRLAREALAELDSMVDAALVATGLKVSTVNRRRGQIRYHRRLNERGFSK